MTAPENPFIQFVERYRNEPVLFVREVLGSEPTDYQAEALRAIADGTRRMSIRSGHGTGKTTMASWAALWFIALRYPAKVVITAPTSTQLFDALYSEMVAQLKRAKPGILELFEILSDRILLRAAPEESFISFRTSRADSPEALAGVHAENVLLIIDEASGVHEKVFEAAAGSMSGERATTLLIGNPTRTSGTFFLTHTQLSHQWWTRRWSCLESPLVSAEFVEEMKQRYGEQSNAYRVRVLGEFPQGDDDTILPHDLVTAAMDRDVSAAPDTPSIWGLDVARFGSNATALAKRRGAEVTQVMRWRGLDLMQVVGRVKAEYDGLPPSMRPKEIMVDALGMGAGAYDRLRELGLPVRAVNVTEAPAFGEVYANLRTELWFRLRGWLEQRTCRLPKDPDLLAELCSIRYFFRERSGKIMAEGKDDMKKRGLRSPDMADALCLTFASDAATALGASFALWSKPIRRGLKGVV